MKFNGPASIPKNRPRTDDQRTARMQERQKWDRRKDDVASAMLAANILGWIRFAYSPARASHNPETTYTLIVQTMEELIPHGRKS